MFLHLRLFHSKNAPHLDDFVKKTVASRAGRVFDTVVAESTSLTDDDSSSDEEDNILLKDLVHDKKKRKTA